MGIFGEMIHGIFWGGAVACIGFSSWVEFFFFFLVTLVLVGLESVAVDHGAWKMNLLILCRNWWLGRGGYELTV